MTIPTNAEILTQLDRLDTQTADDLETQWLEFKPWTGPRDDMRVAIEYAVCFANAEGGVIVFGVADRTRGRAAAIQGIGRCDLDIWRRDIFNSTRPHLEVAVEELTVPEGTGRLLVVRVPKGPTPPYGTMQGLFKQRVGKNSMPMDPHAFARAQASAGIVDWSGLPAEGVEVGDLDLVEIARARNVLRRFKPQSELLKVDDTSLLVGVGAIQQGRVTRAGLLLFGNASLVARICPQHQVHYVLHTELKVFRNDSFRDGLLNILEQIERAFSGPANPEHEVSVGFFKMRIPAFDVDVVREALLNAMTHRDYTDPNEVLLRHTAGSWPSRVQAAFWRGLHPEHPAARAGRAQPDAGRGVREVGARGTCWYGAEADLHSYAVLRETDPGVRDRRRSR